MTVEQSSVKSTVTMLLQENVNKLNDPVLNTEVLRKILKWRQNLIYFTRKALCGRTNLVCADCVTVEQSSVKINSNQLN